MGRRRHGLSSLTTLTLHFSYISFSHYSPFGSPIKRALVPTYPFLRFTTRPLAPGSSPGCLGSSPLASRATARSRRARRAASTRCLRGSSYRPAGRSPRSCAYSNDADASPPQPLLAVAEGQGAGAPASRRLNAAVLHPPSHKGGQAGVGTGLSLTAPSTQPVPLNQCSPCRRAPRSVSSKKKRPCPGDGQPLGQSGTLIGNRAKS